jgi:hypothetical protein
MPKVWKTPLPVNVRKAKLSEMKQCQEACQSSAGVVPIENEKPAFAGLSQ